MKIRMRINIGVFHGYPNVRRGDVVDVDEANALRYISLGYAEAVADDPKPPKPKPVERAVPEEPVETATADAVEDEPDAGLPVPLDEQADEAPSDEESKPVRRRPPTRK